MRSRTPTTTCLKTRPRSWCRRSAASWMRTRSSRRALVVAQRPVRRRERRQAMRAPRLVALRAGGAEFPRRRHIAARLRPLRVDAARAAHADVRIQGDATWLLAPAGALHGHLVGVDALGQLRRDKAAQGRFGLRPVQADAVGGAAGAAAEAGVGHGSSDDGTKPRILVAGRGGSVASATICG